MRQWSAGCSPAPGAPYNSKRLNDTLQLAEQTGIFELADQAGVQASIDISAEKRANVFFLLKCALGLSVVIAVSIATLISKELTSKLMIVRENARRLARGETLLPVLKGKDEISEFDRSFHYAVNKIEQGTRKEQAILANAGDLICAFDEKLRVQSINPAGEALLKLDSDAIIGVGFLKFIKESEKENIDKLLFEAKEKGSRVDMETVLQGASGTEFDAILSVSYSVKDKAFYYLKNLRFSNSSCAIRIKYSTRMPLCEEGGNQTAKVPQARFALH